MGKKIITAVSYAISLWSKGKDGSFFQYIFLLNYDKRTEIVEKKSSHHKRLLLCSFLFALGRWYHFLSYYSMATITNQTKELRNINYRAKYFAYDCTETIFEAIQLFLDCFYWMFWELGRHGWEWQVMRFFGEWLAYVYLNGGCCWLNYLIHFSDS